MDTCGVTGQEMCAGYTFLPKSGGWREHEQSSQDYARALDIGHGLDDMTGESGIFKIRGSH